MTDTLQTDYSRKWLAMASLGMGIFLSTIDGSIVNVALPTLVKNFNSSFAVVQWVALAYMLTLATLILSMGRLGDIIGKKQVYTWGMIIFTASSALCGLSQTVYMLIVFRVIQGSGAAMMAALGIALITEAFPPGERGKAYGAAGSFVSIGIITGPTLGGILIDAISWHWIFFVNIPIGLIGVFMVTRFVPHSKPVKKQRFDYWGAAVFFISVLSFLLAVTFVQRLGFNNPFIIGLLGIWLIFLIVFLFVESKTAQPMIDLHLFKSPLLGINLITGFTAFIGTTGVVLLMPFFLENVLGYNPHQVGFLLSVVPLSAGIVSPFSGALSDRFGTRRIATLGLFIMAVGYAGLTTLNEHTTSLSYILKFLPIGLGIGIFQSPNNSAIMGSASRGSLGLVSSLISVTRVTGQSIGIALIGAFWNSRLMHYSGIVVSQGSQKPPVIEAHVKSLQETLFVTTLLIVTALILNSLGFFVKRLQRGCTPGIKKSDSSQNFL
jgi:EmrB/QacA subfamily drug resistance transporter